MLSGSFSVEHPACAPVSRSSHCSHRPEGSPCSVFWPEDELPPPPEEEQQNYEGVEVGWRG